MGGLLPEVHALRQRGLAANTGSATRAIGYRQGLEWLAQVAETRHADLASIQRLALDVAAASRQLQRAQMTYHRKHEHFCWLDATQRVRSVVDEIVAQAAQPAHQGVNFVHVAVLPGVPCCLLS